MPTALIVEDEPDANHLLSLLVQTRGYEAASALTGAQALQILRERIPDVVLLDLMLPDLDGFEVCRSMRSNPLTALVPVVFVTARNTPDTELAAYEAGANGFLPKPYLPAQLFDTLRIADDWRRDAAHLPASGVIVADPTNLLACRRCFSRLACLARGHFSNSPDEVDALLTALHRLVDHCLAWRRQQGGTGPAPRFSYRIDDSQITIRVEDDSGWLKDDPSVAVELSALDRGASFTVAFDEGGSGLTLVRPFGPLLAGPA
jgi:CheY-like chemotaxis protein